MISCNMASWDRFIRIVVGILLVAWAVAGGPFWAYIGVLPIFIGAWGFCPLYVFLGIKTKRDSKK